MTEEKKLWLQVVNQKLTKSYIYKYTTSKDSVAGMI